MKQILSAILFLCLAYTAHSQGSAAPTDEIVASINNALRAAAGKKFNGDVTTKISDQDFSLSKVVVAEEGSFNGGLRIKEYIEMSWADLGIVKIARSKEDNGLSRITVMIFTSFKSRSYEKGETDAKFSYEMMMYIYVPADQAEAVKENLNRLKELLKDK